MTVPGRFRVTGMVVLALLVLASCAKARELQWRKPGATTEDWSRDQIECRSLARGKVDRELRQRGSEAGAPAYGGSRTLDEGMAVHEARNRERRLFESCLRQRGYTKSEPGRGA